VGSRFWTANWGSGNFEKMLLEILLLLPFLSFHFLIWVTLGDWRNVGRVGEVWLLRGCRPDSGSSACCSAVRVVA
jgi:hypothetical protein